MMKYDEPLGDAEIKEIQSEIAALVQPIQLAPKDGTRIFAYGPSAKGKGRYSWYYARWVQDHRDDRSERRHDLMMKHDGYWSKGVNGSTEPLKHAPLYWLPVLPDISIQEPLRAVTEG